MLTIYYIMTLEPFLFSAALALIFYKTRVLSRIWLAGLIGVAGWFLSLIIGILSLGYVVEQPTGLLDINLVAHYTDLVGWKDLTYGMVILSINAFISALLASGILLFATALIRKTREPQYFLAFILCLILSLLDVGIYNWGFLDNFRKACSIAPDPAQCLKNPAKYETENKDFFDLHWF